MKKIIVAAVTALTLATAFTAGGQSFFRIVSEEGPQVGDLNLWNARALSERFFSGKRYILDLFKGWGHQCFEGFHRLCSQRWSPAQRVRFACKSYFDDALLLFEILVSATGEGRPALAQWQEAQRRRPHRERSRIGARKRRPRRRKRR